MPDPNAILSSSIRFDTKLERPAVELLAEKTPVRVEFDEERSAVLDPDDPRASGFAQVLEGLQAQKLPVYVEVDPETSVISRLLIPHVTRISGVTELDEGGLDIEIERSHARHRLGRGSDAYDELADRLRDALKSGEVVLLVEDDDHEIIDIHDYRPGPEEAPPPFPKPEPLPELAWPWRWFRCIFNLCCWLPLWWCKCITKTRAQQVFDAMKATSCDPSTVPPPCIPFLYPDDGCWGRAHEMCRLMIDVNLKPKKVWIQGSLHVVTANKPNCNVYWGWHVAPTLCVRTWWWFGTTDMVIDPSLFDGPVTKAAWKSVQGDPNATLTDSSAEIFYYWNGSTDPTYVQTNQVLATYRLHLQNRTLQYGPPPYANCP